MKPSLLIASEEKEYALLDSGGEEKLERFGDIVMVRPDPQALWEKRMPTSEWRKADYRYERKGKGGTWHTRQGAPKEWSITYANLILSIRPTSFKHVGLFPEQKANWEWTRSILKSRTSRTRILNLFAYTGGATLAAAQAGADVVHLDASKSAVSWARENAALCGLADKRITWIVEDALSFVKREEKRGNKYDGIIMDPPAFGHGPKDELWKIEEHFLPLLRSCVNLLSEQPLFFLVNGYASGYSPIAFVNNLLPLSEKFGKEVEYGELTIQESKDGRLLPAGVFARYSI
ncbi:MAG: class I SAM-dependent methyltransferase [Patescibacteria group bacterium]|nr:class I SAM-dependent methyltransferase [Patescibacteria group bacterium]